MSSSRTSSPSRVSTRVSAPSTAPKHPAAPLEAWRPHEHLPRYSLVPLRSRLLPPRFAKRRFFAPRLNRVGLSLPEASLAAAALAAVVVLALTQRTASAADSGDIAQLFFVALFLFITYRSPIAYIFGLSFERAVLAHSFVALLATAYSVWHGLASVFWAHLGSKGGRLPVQGLSAFSRGPYRFEFVTGLVATIFMILTLLVSVNPVRALNRRIWLISHHILPLLAVSFSVIHGAPAVLVGVAVYLVDRLYGYVYQALFQYREIGSRAHAQVLQSGLTMLSFPRELHSFVPGQFMCIQVPNVSVFEYHAFSIASIPSDENLVFLIKDDGVWTRNLQKKVKNAMGASAQPVDFPARLHGPVGSVALDWQSARYKAFVLVAGGIGITPLLSIFRDLVEQKRRGRPLDIVQLIWCTRSQQLVDDVVVAQIKAKGNSLTQKSVEEGCSQMMPGIATEIYLTKLADESREYPYVAGDNENVAKVFGHVIWNAGRPGLKNAFASVERNARSVQTHRVAVLACGPDGLKNDVFRVSSKLGSRAIQFDLHLEHFS